MVSLEDFKPAMMDPTFGIWIDEVHAHARDYARGLPVRSAWLVRGSDHWARWIDVCRAAVQVPTIWQPMLARAKSATLSGAVTQADRIVLDVHLVSFGTVEEACARPFADRLWLQGLREGTAEPAVLQRRMCYRLPVGVTRKEDGAGAGLDLSFWRVDLPEAASADHLQFCLGPASHTLELDAQMRQAIDQARVGLRALLKDRRQRYAVAIDVRPLPKEEPIGAVEGHSFGGALLYGSLMVLRDEVANPDLRSRLNAIHRSKTPSPLIMAKLGADGLSLEAIGKPETKADQYIYGHRRVKSCVPIYYSGQQTLKGAFGNRASTIPELIYKVAEATLPSVQEGFKPIPRPDELSSITYWNIEARQYVLVVVPVDNRLVSMARWLWRMGRKAFETLKAKVDND